MQTEALRAMPLRTTVRLFLSSWLVTASVAVPVRAAEDAGHLAAAPAPKAPRTAAAAPSGKSARAVGTPGCGDEAPSLKRLRGAELGPPVTIIIGDTPHAPFARLGV